MGVRDRYGPQIRQAQAFLRTLFGAPMLGAAVGVVVVFLVPLWDRAFDPTDILFVALGLGLVAGVVGAPVALKRQREFEDLMQRRTG